jgi:hypothetical protein
MTCVPEREEVSPRTSAKGGEEQHTRPTPMAVSKGVPRSTEESTVGKSNESVRHGGHKIGKRDRKRTLGAVGESSSLNTFEAGSHVSILLTTRLIERGQGLT